MSPSLSRLPCCEPHKEKPVEWLDSSWLQSYRGVKQQARWVITQLLLISLYNYDFFLSVPLNNADFSRCWTSNLTFNAILQYNKYSHSLFYDPRLPLVNFDFWLFCHLQRSRTMAPIGMAGMLSWCSSVEVGIISLVVFLILSITLLALCVKCHRWGKHNYEKWHSFKYVVFL